MNRKRLKKIASKRVFKNYFRNIIVVFIALIIFNGGYKYTTIKVNDITTYSVNIIKNNKTNADIASDFYNLVKPGTSKIVNPKYTRGIIAIFFNEITASGSFIFGVINVINTYLFSGKIKTVIILILGIILSILGFIFIKNVIIIGVKRYFLEQRCYNKTNINRILYPYKEKAVLNIAYIMLKRFIYQTFWNFTIIYGFIKHYEYLMIPYILAENPNISCKDAFRLSKEMMVNHKLEAFKLDLSLLGWKLLEALTLNLSSIFYYNVYRETIRSEYYVQVRNLEYNKLNNKELLKDDLLYLDEEINEEYPYIKTKNLNINYQKKYSFENLILLFFSCAIIGWLWEVIIGLIDMGVFVNRGTMHGPWLPIYGWGALAILIVLKPLRDKPWLLFISSLILCGIIEYTTGWYLETFKGLKWWDYSGYFMSLNGRICLEGLIIFGLAGVTCTYLLAPLLDDLFNLVNLNFRRIVCLLLVIVYIIDLTYSSKVPNTGYGVATSLNNYQIINKV